MEWSLSAAQDVVAAAVPGRDMLVFQDVFVRVLRALPSYRPRGSFPGWLHRITQNSLLKNTGFAIVELDPPGPTRTVSIKVVTSANGDVMFQKILPVPQF